MRIDLLTEDILLVDMLKQYGEDKGVTFSVYAEPELFIFNTKQAPADILIISDRFFDNHTLADFADQLQGLYNQSKVIVLLSNWHDASRNQLSLKVGVSAGWMIIYPGQSLSMIVQKLSDICFASTIDKLTHKNRSLLFIGSTPNIGVTVSAFGTAVHMAKLTDSRIGFLCLNLKSSKMHRYLGLDKPTYSLDELRADLRSTSLSKELLLRHCLRIKEQSNLYVLFGNQQREQAEFYTVDDMEHLLKVASDSFDYLIVETNAYWDNAATIAGIMHAGQRIMVTTPELGHFQEDVTRWCRTLTPVFGLSQDSFDLLITRCRSVNNSGEFSTRDVRRDTSMSKIGEIRKEDILPSLLNQGRLWEAVARDSVISQDFERLARTLLTLHGASIKTSTIPQGWLHMLIHRVRSEKRRLGLVNKRV
jgi:septum formation inhibitor-activating ATPase MinD